MDTASRAPGVYVQEVASGTAPILGVGTSTAGFIGIISKDSIAIPEPNPDYKSGSPDKVISLSPTSSSLKGQTLAQALTLTVPRLESGTVVNEKIATALKATTGQALFAVKSQDLTTPDGLKSTVLLEDVIGKDDSGAAVNLLKGHVIQDAQVNSIAQVLKQQKRKEVKVQEILDLADDKKLIGKILGQPFQLKDSLAIEFPIGTQLDEATAQLIADYSDAQPVQVKGSTAPYITKAFPETGAITADVVLCTNFGEFKAAFGDFSLDSGQNILAHAVYGFFRNGGTRCYVKRIKSDSELQAALGEFEAIDDIAIVCAPGITDATKLKEINDHCTQPTLQDRVAVLDSPCEVQNQTKLNPQLSDRIVPEKCAYAALYFPWIQVYDPVTKLQDPQSNGLKFVPPSGHIAGIYARVDSQRGVHKAPANEPILGAVGVRYNISKNQQGSLNDNGINCIRNLNGSILVWGARTLGGGANGEFMYLNVRRLFNYLRESIDEGTQWTVFEPNSPELWARIRRNVNAFLLGVWRSGALFGSVPEEAFYVKCDAETNPPDVRDRGQVVIEIGVAVVKPAEFVIFNLSQWAGSSK
jgi:uncharacterized protein